jgi:2-keto-3-deoxy-L-rhamnonate aldolase RhmA
MPNRFKDRLGSGPPQIGVFASLAAPAAAEALACHGFDFVMIDLEHAPNDVAGLPALLAAVEAGGADAVVRAPWNDAVWLKRILDAGAKTVMVPFIESAAEAASANRAVRYPPHGIRGVAGATRASRFGARADYFQVADRETCLLLQVETVAAVDKIGEIAAVPGVDGVFIGPSDLAASMGRLGDPRHAEVQAKIQEGLRLGRAAGAKMGVLGTAPEHAVAYQKDGFDFILHGTELGMLIRQMKADIAAIRAGGWTPRTG